MHASIQGTLLYLTSLTLVLAQHAGHDSADTTLTQGHMVPYLHFKGGDTLWFEGWVPESKGAIAGTCIGLFLLAIFDRWLGAMRVVAETYWNKRAQIDLANKRNAQSTANKRIDTSALMGLLTLRTIPPFIPSHDITRGVLYGAQTLLGFAFMLAVMTFHAGIIISIVIGMGVGETLFGRYSAARTTSH